MTLTAKDLFNSTNTLIYRSYLDKYKTRLRGSTEAAAQLDDKLRLVQKQLKKRSPPHLLPDELLSVVEWKLNIGQWRPRMELYARTNSKEFVKGESAAAFKEAEELDTDELEQDDRDAIVKSCIKTLSALKGIGPATASLILSLYSPHFAFMSDEASLAVLPEPLRYSESEYIRFNRAMHKKAEELNEKMDMTRNKSKYEGKDATEKGDAGEFKFTARSVAEALWSCSHSSGEENETKKRKPMENKAQLKPRRGRTKKSKNHD